MSTSSGPIHNLRSIADLAHTLAGSSRRMHGPMPRQGVAQGRRGDQRRMTEPAARHVAEPSYRRTLLQAAISRRRLHQTLALGRRILTSGPALARGGQAALRIATVVETWGSAPRPIGSTWSSTTRGNFLGSVSGGCVEGAVVIRGARRDPGRQAQDALEFGVADETAWRVGLSCGGTIRVYVEKIS